MAKFKAKKRGKTRTIVKTKTRRVYVAAKKAARRARRAGGERMGAADIVLAVGGAGVGSIGGSILLSKIPAGVPDVAKNGGLAAIGGFLAYKGLRKKNRLFLGLGLGAAAAGVTNVISGLISGGTVSGVANWQLAAPYNTLGAPYNTLGTCSTMGAPLAEEAEEM